MSDWPPKYGSEAYEDLLDDTAAVLDRFFGAEERFNPQAEAYRVLATYLAFVSDAWARETAQTRLETLEDAITKLALAFRDLPSGVRDGLELDASQVDWLARERFLNTTTLDIVTKAHLPEERATAAMKGLVDLAAGVEPLQQAIRTLNKRLPEGIPTRNRPMQDWAIVEAAAELCRAHEIMSVPKSLGNESPFKRLLEALFPIFRATTTPQGIFGGWYKHIDSNRENLDLLDM